MTIRNNHNIYIDDLHGYDDLFRFIDVFPTIEDFCTKLNENLYFNEIHPHNTAVIKLYNMLFNRYKNNFFRYSKLATIYLKVGERIETLLQQFDVAIEFSSNLEELVANTTKTTNYNTDNTHSEEDEKNELIYRTDVSTTVDTNSAEYMKRKENSIQLVTVMQEFVNDFRKLMMNKTDEVVTKQIYTR